MSNSLNPPPPPHLCDLLKPWGHKNRRFFCEVSLLNFFSSRCFYHILSLLFFAFLSIVMFVYSVTSTLWIFFFWVIVVVSGLLDVRTISSCQGPSTTLWKLGSCFGCGHWQFTSSYLRCTIITSPYNRSMNINSLCSDYKRYAYLYTQLYTYHIYFCFSSFRSKPVTVTVNTVVDSQSFLLYLHIHMHHVILLYIIIISYIIYGSRSHILKHWYIIWWMPYDEYIDVILFNGQREAIYTGSAVVLEGAGPQGAPGVVQIYPGRGFWRPSWQVEVLGNPTKIGQKQQKHWTNP